MTHLVLEYLLEKKNIEDAFDCKSNSGNKIFVNAIYIIDVTFHAIFYRIVVFYRKIATNFYNFFRQYEYSYLSFTIQSISNEIHIQSITILHQF